MILGGYFRMKMKRVEWGGSVTDWFLEFSSQF